MTVPDEAGFGVADLMLRLGAATLCGLLIGLERGKDAGLRMHALAALSSAVITVSALSLQRRGRERSTRRGERP